jgi:hypothetical protein
MPGQKQLSTKQKRFAKLVASGASKAEAYDKAYTSNGGKRANRGRAGFALANKPAMRELIERYEAQLVPLGDLRIEQENMLSNLKNLAYESPDDRVRMASSVKLFELLEVFRERQHKYKALSPAIPVDAVVTELLQLAESQPAIELETVASETDETTAETDTDQSDETE